MHKKKQIEGSAQFEELKTKYNDECEKIFLWALRTIVSLNDHLTKSQTPDKNMFKNLKEEEARLNVSYNAIQTIDKHFQKQGTPISLQYKSEVKIIHFGS